MLVATPLARASGEYPLPAADQRLIGQPRLRTTIASDTLARIAREEGVGLEALRRLNSSVDPWLPTPGTELVLPTQMLLPSAHRDGIVINRAERRLFFFDGERQRLLVYPVGIGVEGFQTPVLSTHTVTSIYKPNWTPTASIRQEHLARGDVLPPVVPPGPDNPMGDYAIKLAEPSLFIHGTNQPRGVGQRVSHGCIRLYANHIETLVRSLPGRTPVHIIDQAHKVAWVGDQLYLESHRTESGENQLTAMVAQVIAATATVAASINWELADRTARAATGIPVVISRPVNRSAGTGP